MKSKYQRVLLGALAAGLLTLPTLGTAFAAQAKKAPAKPAAKGDVKAGKEAYAKEGCTGCHKTKDYTTAGEIGPDLSAIGKNHSFDKIATYIKKPKQGSIMPAFKGPEKTVNDITAYLLTQK